MNCDIIRKRLEGNRLLILGFGKEGQATYRFVRKLFPQALLAIADQRDAIIDIYPELRNDNQLEIITGSDYLKTANEYDIIIKTPGISLSKSLDLIDVNKITSQTDLFLSQFANQTIGITGTKGKSTTTSLIYHVLSAKSDNVLLVGNIGLPPFDQMERIDEKTIIVFELSSHQLEYLTRAPHISILLNIFQEHLDHYNSYKDYQLAKFNITLKQEPTDIFICPFEDELINILLKEFSIERQIKTFSLEALKTINGVYLQGDKMMRKEGLEIHPIYDINSKCNLIGSHNLLNIGAAFLACESFVESSCFFDQLLSFKGLPHRIQFVGTFDDVLFYNDSIATIPEATIQAIEALKDVDVLLLGGFDRGIDYSILAEYLKKKPIRIIYFMGEAGLRIFENVKMIGVDCANWKIVENMEEAVLLAKINALKNKICLLSPAASSYDSYKNFEHRGQCFIDLVSR